VLRAAVDKAKLGRGDALFALRQLDTESRRLESAAQGPAFNDLIADEFAQSHDYGGRSVFGWEPKAAPTGSAAHRASANAK
jgi:hypothetical protein